MVVGEDADGLPGAVALLGIFSGGRPTIGSNTDPPADTGSVWTIAPCCVASPAPSRGKAPSKCDDATNVSCAATAIALARPWSGSAW
jgi:hypothetical protein